MQEDSSEARPDSDAAWALARLVNRIGKSVDEPAVLTAAMEYLQRFRPQGARLSYLQLDAQGVPYEFQTVAEWRDDALPARHPDQSPRYPLGSDPIVQRCLGQSDLPLLLTDVATEYPQAALHGWFGPAGCSARVLLPLHNQGHGGWQGMLDLYWEKSHAFSPPERSAYQLVMGVLAMHIGGRRAQRTLADALDEAALLQRVTEQLNVATSLEQALNALLLPAPHRQDIAVALCSIDAEPDGTLPAG